MFKLFKSFSRLDTRRYFFTRRVVEPWKNFPQEVVCADCEEDFKTFIDSNSSTIMYVLVYLYFYPLIRYNRL